MKVRRFSCMKYLLSAIDVRECPWGILEHHWSFWPISLLKMPECIVRLASRKPMWRRIRLSWPMRAAS